MSDLDKISQENSISNDSNEAINITYTNGSSKVSKKISNFLNSKQ